ncbi:uncharacterized protein LOC131940750 [Physella acuta]|uniref:uncharacterized protein LOC131940750 n=1 Tax=Physella acuta TaxID=109671 RepID=UPI0027DDF98D|nr:uncharacterized protein LOC131940750 [Physella acuta]XP_059155518.1 uncharacterized protein LOC131940750 [Physella acuta]XP_059155519.1 uncharacterized protein LOC131940750 [Physella acuta]XP_059155520.1 uncharacterized protein LOC131940750 [Physella acuta]
MEYLAKLSTLGMTSRPMKQAAVVTCLLAVFFSTCISTKDEPSNRVSIEDFIDLDESEARDSGVKVRAQVKHRVSADNGSDFKTTDVTFDDDDLFASGSGSGSGDDDNATVRDANGRLTPTVTSPTTSTSTEQMISLLFDIEEGGVETNLTGPSDTNFVISKRNNDNHIVVVDPSIDDSDNDPDDSNRMDDDADSNRMEDDADSNRMEDDADSHFAHNSQAEISSNQILSPASWEKWSDWITASKSSKVRVRACRADESSAEACQGVRVQVRSCGDAQSDQCGEVKDMGTMPAGACRDTGSKDSFLKAPPPPPPVPKSPPPTVVKPSPDVCQYSLYDTYRQKFVYLRWGLTDLLTKSKVKRWCSRKSGQYLVMSSPQEHCRRHYRDFCKNSEKCVSNKPTKERGDFAEGCWRNLVYGEMLPVGLSNKQTVVYLICQRFAAQTRMGKSFGFKDTHYVTLYDVSIRSPILSLTRVTALGDETWPVTDYFIEHGLVEKETTMLWFYRKPKKGMLTLLDLDRCHDDQSCDVGLRQVLPQDYKDATGYRPTHLMWPELMPFEPATRLATFTMTNMAPMLAELFEEWHLTIRKVRTFAIEQCGVPAIVDTNFRHVSEFSSHRYNKSALYLASGIMPSTNPVQTTGHNIRVPFMFWLAGCCVQQYTLTNHSLDNSSSIYWNDTSNDLERTNTTAFAVYIRNSADNHVIPAPVLQLEMLLQDMYKTSPGDLDVSLFPGHDQACSDLKNDVSRWFQ